MPEPSASATPTSVASAVPAATGVPSRAAVRRLMARTSEIGTSDGYFVLNDGPVTIGDGQGGTLTAAIGQRYPTADAHGQLVFFWHGTRFLGLDSVRESDTITRLSATGTGVFRVTYAHYASKDAECCPSLPPVTVLYRWTGQRLSASGTPPLHGAPIRVRVLP